MNNKCLKVTTLLAALLLGMGPAAAQAQLKIGVVNVRQLMEESPQARAATRASEDEFAQRKRELENQQKEYKARADKFQRDSAVMSQAERDKAEREMRDNQRDFERKVNEYQEDVQVRQNEEIGRMQRALLEEVQTYAKAQGYDLVLGEGVLYAKEAVNITSAVLSALEAKAKPAATPPAK